MATINETLRSGGKRARIHNAQAVFKLPQDAKDLVKKVSDATGLSEGAIHREALAEYLERRGYRS